MHSSRVAGPGVVCGMDGDERGASIKSAGDRGERTADQTQRIDDGAIGAQQRLGAPHAFSRHGERIMMDPCDLDRAVRLCVRPRPMP